MRAHGVSFAPRSSSPAVTGSSRKRRNSARQTVARRVASCSRRRRDKYRAERSRRSPTVRRERCSSAYSTTNRLSRSSSKNRPPNPLGDTRDHGRQKTAPDHCSAGPGEQQRQRRLCALARFRRPWSRCVGQLGWRVECPRRSVAAARRDARAPPVRANPAGSAYPPIRRDHRRRRQRSLAMCHLTNRARRRSRASAASSVPLAGIPYGGPAKADCVASRIG